MTASAGRSGCARGLIVLLDGDEPDVVRHDVAMPRSPARRRRADRPAGLVHPAPTFRIVDDVDLWNVDVPVGPAETFLWTKAPPLPDDPVVHRAARSPGPPTGSDRHRPATPRRHQPGRRAPWALDGVIAHTIMFHEPFRARRVAAARPRVPVRRPRPLFGTADVFTEDALDVASYVQTNMIRFFADPSMADGSQYRTVM